MVLALPADVKVTLDTMAGQYRERMAMMWNAIEFPGKAFGEKMGVEYIEISGAEGQVEADTSGGSIDVEFASGNSEGGSLSTSGGGIRVTLDAGANHAWVTLHVGAGTFQSLREEDIRDNRLHSERVEVGADCCDAIAATKDAGGRVIAIGTTSVRALECASAAGRVQPFNGETDMFILPGYEFRTVDAMITNFHLPQSSLLMLVAAFAGQDRVLEAYRHAVREKYRFFSYGDAMFLTPDVTE